MSIPPSLPNTNTLQLLLVYECKKTPNSNPSIQHHRFNHLTFATAAQTHTHTPSLLQQTLLTGVIFTADAGVPSLSAGTHSSIQAGVGVTQVDLRLAVITREANWAAAAKARDGMDGPKQDGGRGDEGCGAVETQHRDALHVVLARLTQTHVVVERENLE